MFSTAHPNVRSLVHCSLGLQELILFRVASTHFIVTFFKGVFIYALCPLDPNARLVCEIFIVIEVVVTRTCFTCHMYNKFIIKRRPMVGYIIICDFICFWGTQYRARSALKCKTAELLLPLPTFRRLMRALKIKVEVAHSPFSLATLRARRLVRACMRAYAETQKLCS